MPRRSEPVELVAARQKLRARFDAQQRAAAAFFDTNRRADTVRTQLERLEAEQCVHVATLADATDITTTATLVGWTPNRVREAVQHQRPQRAHHNGTGDEAGSEHVRASTGQR